MCQRGTSSTSAASSTGTGAREAVAQEPDRDRQHEGRVAQGETPDRVEHRHTVAAEADAEQVAGEGRDDGRDHALADEPEGDIGVARHLAGQRQPVGEAPGQQRRQEGDAHHRGVGPAQGVRADEDADRGRREGEADGGRGEEPADDVAALAADGLAEALERGLEVDPG
jgi:hypothetical protein